MPNAIEAQLLILKREHIPSTLQFSSQSQNALDPVSPYSLQRSGTNLLQTFAVPSRH
jgi:hypothetical protein